MPVSVLLCEGEDNSPDGRLLHAILRGTGVQIEPSGGKDAFAGLIRGRRRQNPGVCGLVDGDFPRDPDAWTETTDPGPRRWTMRDRQKQIVLGWTWGRKEVENYLVDPEVLARALRWTPETKKRYLAQIERVFDTLGHVTAARIALTCCAPRRNRINTEVPLAATKEKLAQELHERADAYTEGARLDRDKLLQVFERHVPDCLSGRFRQHAIEVFAGKDILAKIQSTSGFDQELKVLKNQPALEERVLNALEHDAEPHAWLPEWAALRSAVETWMPAPETEATNTDA
ncbi:hypothetical protein [Sorangium sp. So ce426]|uniref:hypothetical protein n=1 Tax=Sorangium sp. So ce426 TaxID=3133312 RepID=UPI003F5B17AE